MKRPQNQETWGRETARKRYAEGGNVVALPLSPNATASALERLKGAGMVTEHTKDFAAHRLKSFGLDPAARIGRDAPDWKKDGGRT